MLNGWKVYLCWCEPRQTALHYLSLKSKLTQRTKNNRELWLFGLKETTLTWLSVFKRRPAVMRSGRKFVRWGNELSMFCYNLYCSSLNLYGYSNWILCCFLTWYNRKTFLSKISTFPWLYKLLLLYQTYNNYSHWNLLLAISF